MHAVETYYAGCRFRSRLEARWAVIFDVWDLKWDYEPERYRLGKSSYLPDFKVYGLCTRGDYVWFEVKGAKPADSYWDMIAAFAHEDPGNAIYVNFGEIPRPDQLDVGGFACKEDCCYDSMWTPTDCQHRFTVCATCHALGIEFEARSARLPCGCNNVDDKLHNGNDPFIALGFAAGRSARFEYGQSGGRSDRTPVHH